MSGTSSTSVVAGGVGDAGGGCYYKPPFTAVQWQELEHQAMVYKYLLAGLPVPPELVVPIRRSFEAISSRLFSNPALGYYSYYGKKFDPEPGRCRRTDGKKWRCAKDAYPDSRYCERHMHRGRNRSRKPVESHSTSSSSPQSVSSAASHVVTGGGGSSSSSISGIFQNNSGNSTFQNMPLHSVVNPESLYSGTGLTKLQIDPGLYGSHNKDYRYVHGFSSDAEPGNFSPEASGNVRNLGVGSDIGRAWCLLPSQVSSSSIMRSQNDQNELLGQSLELDMGHHALDPMMEGTMSKQQRQKQHSLFSNEIEPMKHEQHSAMRPFFDECPSSTKESWSNLDHGRTDKSRFSKTHLSISIPMSSNSDFSSPRDACSPDDEFK